MEKEFSSKEIQLVVFKIGKEEFGVPIGEVKEIVRLIPVTPVPRAPDFVEGVVNLRGQILAIIDLAKKLKLTPSPRSDKNRIVVIEFEDNIIGMIVDEVLEVLRLASDNIDNTPELISTEIHEEYLKGIGKLGDRLLILIDLARVFSHEEAEDIKRAREQQQIKKEE